MCTVVISTVLLYCIVTLARLSLMTNKGLLTYLLTLWLSGTGWPRLSWKMAIKRVWKSFEFKVIIWMKFCRQVVLGIVNKLLFFESIAVIFWNISSYSRLLCRRPWFSASQRMRPQKNRMHSFIAWRNQVINFLTQVVHIFYASVQRWPKLHFSYEIRKSLRL